MVVTFVWSFPSDPKADAENFQRKQAELEAAYHHTGEPFALYEALLNAEAYLRFPAVLNWLVTAVGEFIMRDRTKDTAERFKERMRHVQRYRCVRDLRQKHLNKDGVLECLTKNQALDRAVAIPEATDAAAKRGTIEASYDKVSRDLKKKGRKSEFFWLVARSDPTVVPVSVTRRADGVTVINGVAQRPKGGPDR